VGNQDRKLRGHTSSNMGYCEIPHKEGWTKGTNCNTWSFGPSILSERKANVIANYLENLFTPHEVCDTDHERRVEARIQALLTTVDETAPVKFRPCDVSKEIRSLKLGKACGIDDIPNECLRHLPRRSLVHITHLFNHCLRLCLLKPREMKKNVTSGGVRCSK
jgi:hypothetical protein